MKKLTEFVKTEFKRTYKVFKPLKYKSAWALVIGLLIAGGFYDEHRIGKENYNLLPRKESEILQKYNGGIKGWYHMEDMRKLFIDYDLVARESPREIPELMRHRKKVNEPNDYNSEQASFLE